MEPGLTGHVFTDNRTVASMQGPFQAFKAARLFSPHKAHTMKPRFTRSISILLPLIPLKTRLVGIIFQISLVASYV